MEDISKYKALAAMVRGFFNAYSSGIIDCHVADAYEKRKPQTVKKIMLERYEQIGGAFHDVMFYPIAHLNYSEDEITQKVQQNFHEGMTMMELVEIACRTEELHRAMINEYKRNFEFLLQGRMPNSNEHDQDYTRGNEIIDADNAIKLVVRVVMTAYAEGVKQSGVAEQKFHQPSILRLVLDAMTVLLNDVAPDENIADNTEGLAGLFMKACKKKEYFRLMTEAMDEEMGSNYEL